MENTVATASRNLLAIKRRKYGHYAYRGLQLVSRLGRDVVPDIVALYPAVTEPEDLADLLNRLGWYLPERTVRDDIRLVVPTDRDLDLAAGSIPPSQATFETGHLPLDVVAAESANTAARDADAILLWDASIRFRPTALRNLPKLEFVDPSYFSGVESYTWGAVSNLLRTGARDASVDRFRALERRAAEFERAFVFATGPSLDRATEFEFDDDDLTIVCNSIVRNDDMLAHIDPDVLVFADPVFHFGPSRYAATFREDAVSALRDYDCVGFVPSRHRSLLAGHYPDLGLVGLTGVDVDEPPFPTASDPRVMSTNNIMTWFMLPIASSLADDVYVIGADGRKEDESYFWQHNEDAQYDDDLMQSAVDTHPSFFRDRVYADYYDDHCQTLADFLEYGESRGVDYYSLTDSYIDCLAARRVDAILERSAETDSPDQAASRRENQSGSS